MRVLLIGDYGAGNLGDEAILQGMLQVLAERGLAREDLAVYSWNPEETTSLFGVPSIQRDDNRNLPEDYDRLIVGGGGIFYAANVPLYFRWIFQYLTLPKPVEVYGVGTDELYGAAPFLREVLNKVDDLSVRTEWDKGHLESIGVNREIRVVDCPSLLVPTPSWKGIVDVLGKHFDVSRPLIGICLKPCRIGENFTHRFLSYIRNRVLPEYDLVPLIMCRHLFSPDEMDEVSLRALFKKLDLFDGLEEWFSMKFTPSFMKGVVQSMDRVITNRKHPMMFAAQKGIPVMVIEDTPTFILSKYARCYGVNHAWIW